jgi:hypothetical protein
MRVLPGVLLIILVNFLPQALFADSSNQTGHLFRIERSINKNFVQFDVRLLENGDLPESSPVVVYWVLENGQHQGLTPIERKYAFGIHSQEKLDKNKFRILLVAFKDREIIVQKIRDSYKAVTSVNGKTSILEKVYVKSEQSLVGFPKVLYVDLLGRTKGAGHSVKERIVSN